MIKNKIIFQKWKLGLATDFNVVQELSFFNKKIHFINISHDYLIAHYTISVNVLYNIYNISRLKHGMSQELVSKRKNSFVV